MRVRRVGARLTGVVLAILVGGGLGAVALSPAGAGAVVGTPVTTTVTKAAAAGCATGKYQKNVEWWLNQDDTVEQPSSV